MAPPRFILWTPEEDKLLTEAVAACGAKICWKNVAKAMSGRDNKACRKRWIHSLDPKLRKGRWSASEDEALLEAVKIHGKRWYEVARDLPGRTDDQCAKRYKEAVDPSIRRDPWTKEEDDQLWEVFQRLGNKWHAISSTLNGRPAVHCRNRLQTLQRLHAVANSAEHEIASQTSESPLDSSLLNFPAASETTSPSSTLTFEEVVRSPSSSSLSSWQPSTPPSEPSPSRRVTVIDATPNMSYASVPVEEIACSTTVGEAHHDPTQSFAFPASDCVPGLFESDSRIFTVADPIQTGYWSELQASQQPWTSTPLTQPTQIVTSSPIRCDPARMSSPVDDNGNDLLSCPGIANPLNVVPNISDAMMAGAAFTMTCPIPHCYFQCQTVVDMWKHLTWSHVRPNSKESGIESIVECVVLGGGS